MVNKIGDADFNDKININKRVIVDCYAEWCGPCKMLGPIMEEVASEHTNCDFYKLNVDEANVIPRKYGIMSIPTILIFENGELKKQLVGFRNKAELIDEINNL